MSSLMGAAVNTGEMFEKLESMRTVVTEVNTQFKNPVRHSFPPSQFGNNCRSIFSLSPGINHVHSRHE